MVIAVKYLHLIPHMFIWTNMGYDLVTAEVLRRSMHDTLHVCALDHRGIYGMF